MTEEKKTTQKDRLLEYLEEFEKVDPLQAWLKLGIYRLSSVIHVLRKEGWDITTKTKEVQNKFGETCHVGEYHLLQEEEPSEYLPGFGLF